MKTITLEQSQDHINKVSKWLLLSPLERLEILKKVNEKRGKNYKTLSAALNSCLKYV